jgi:hypothetical protein
MTRQVISTGSAANDGTGDTLRSASQKINQNFAEIYGFLSGGDSSVLSAGITLEDSAVVYSGNSYDTRLVSKDPTADRLVQIPNANGIIVLETHTQTLTNKTLTAPTISTPKITTSINDTNNNEVIKITATSSAVNEVTIINAATGDDPVIQASGQANRNLSLKGNATTGSVLIERLALDTVDQGASSTVSLTAGHVYFSASTPSSVSLPNGNVEGHYLVISNRKAFAITITPTSANIAGVTSSITLETNESVTLIWDGSSSWYIIGGYGYSIS